MPYVTGDTILEDQYVILKSEDNTDNGMQAMAVAPLDKYVVSSVNWYIVP